MKILEAKSIMAFTSRSKQVGRPLNHNIPGTSNL